MSGKHRPYAARERASNRIKWLRTRGLGYEEERSENIERGLQRSHAEVILGRPEIGQGNGPTPIIKSEGFSKKGVTELNEAAGLIRKKLVNARAKCRECGVREGGKLRGGENKKTSSRGFKGF